MLTDKKIVIEANTVIGDIAICRHIAVIKPEAGTVQFVRTMLDEAACKNNRAVVREDQAAFEDAAYKMLDDVTEDA